MNLAVHAQALFGRIQLIAGGGEFGPVNRRQPRSVDSLGSYMTFWSTGIG